MDLTNNCDAAAHVYGKTAHCVELAHTGFNIVPIIIIGIALIAAGLLIRCCR